MTATVSKLCVARWIALVIILVSPRTAIGDVRVWVVAPANLADARRPMPDLRIRNDSGGPIELDLFGDVPFTILEQRDADGTFDHEEAAICGNGFVARRLSAGHGGRYPLWSLLAHGPGVTGTFRVLLPYVQIEHGGRRVVRQATSRPFRLAYGDVAPAGWSPSPASMPSGVVLTAALAERVRVGVDPRPAAAEVATWLSPGVARCVASTRSRLPWIRGSFALVVYRYPRQAQPVTYVAMSLLGDEPLNACLGGLTVAQEIAGSYELTFSASAGQTH